MTFVRNMSLDLSKPAKGTAQIERRERRHRVDLDEKANKATVRARDRKCRWPGCDCHVLKLRPEVAHIVDKSRGGPSTTANMVLLCVKAHQGAVSLHSGDREIQPQSALGADGCLDFYERNEAGRMELIASEKYRGVSVARSV